MANPFAIPGFDQDLRHYIVPVQKKIAPQPFTRCAQLLFQQVDCLADVGLDLSAQGGLIVQGQDVVTVPGNFILLLR
jgi:hypothetical protein